MNIDEFVKGKLKKMHDLDFERGQSDCTNGIPHASLTKAYLDGYSQQYAEEQQQSQGSSN